MVTLPRFSSLLGSLASLGVVCALLLQASNLTPAERASRLPSWVGCYRLSIGSWSDGLDSSRLPFIPPPVFRLDTTVRRSPLGIALGYMSASPPSPSAQRRYANPPGWDLLGRDSIQVFWGDGFVAVELRLGGVGQLVRTGAARVTSDVIDESRQAPHAVARAVQVGCDGIP
jgi:hypothetical protein